MSEPRDPVEVPARVWSAVFVVAGILLVALGGAVQGFRPEPSGAVPADTPLPTLGEPQGPLPAPPKVFRWTPGGTDVDLSQVAIYRSTLEPLWQSSPVRGSSIEVEPSEVFQGVPAGEELLWRVREVSHGRPRASSAYGRFKFAVDTRGLGPGAAPPEARPLHK
ncbi:MAG: hypothetical protein U0167_18815 [bacterium]